MSRARDEGLSAFDRLRSRYDREDLMCPACGYQDDEGRWLAATSGERVRYRHVCPSCGNIRSREFRFGDE